MVRLIIRRGILVVDHPPTRSIPARAPGLPDGTSRGHVSVVHSGHTHHLATVRLDKHGMNTEWGER